MQSAKRILATQLALAITFNAILVNPVFAAEPAQEIVTESLGDETEEPASGPIKGIRQVDKPEVINEAADVDDTDEKSSTVEISIEPSAWAAPTMKQAAGLGLVPENLQVGYTQPITRAEFCALAVLLFEKLTGSVITERAYFNDTADENVEKMGGLGVITGAGDHTFAPDAWLTREQAAVILTNLCSALDKPLTDHEATFSDKAVTSPWAVRAVGKMQLSEIMKGTGDNAFSPQSSYTREQSILTMLNTYYYCKIKMIRTGDLDSGTKKYGDIAVYYKNLESGYVYRYNAERIYFAASVIKAPYALYVYDLAEKGQADLHSVYRYSGGDYWGGSGVIKNMSAGTAFTESELLAYAIRNSDNIAFRALVRRYGTGGFKEYVAAMGGDPSLIGTVTGANMTANEAGLFANAIYAYIESDRPYSSRFKTDLMSTSNPMIRSDYPIARKYGWAQKSFHDMAIVYSDSPYILVIMTARESGTGRDFAMFKEISMLFQRFNEANFVE